MKPQLRSSLSRTARPLASFVACALPLVTARAAVAAPVAFPGAEGFGAQVTGGRGGKVVHVTNLNDSGAGSFRDAVSQGNRTVVFDVGGLITIATQLVFAGDNLTIAGQTAPAPGITVYGHGTSASNRKNVILRYVRFRQGIDSPEGTKALNVTDGSNMIFDHVSVQWGRWDTVGITGSSSTITIQYSLMGESIDPQRFGGLVDSADKVTLSHNLWLDSQSRSPKFKANGQYINNVVYNWGGNGLGGGHSGADWYEDLINNIFIKGPSSTGGFATGYADTDHVFNSGNVVDLDTDGKLATRAVVSGDFQGDSPPTFHTSAHNVPPVAVTTVTAMQAYDDVVANAGASLCRDPVDLRLIGQVQSLGTKGAIVVDEKAVGGQPSVTPASRPAGFDTDQDGIPDAWETAHGLNPMSATDGNADSGDGYTQVEKYLNELAEAGACSCGKAGTNPGTGGRDAGPSVDKPDASVPQAAVDSGTAPDPMTSKDDAGDPPGAVTSGGAGSGGSSGTGGASGASGSSGAGGSSAGASGSAGTGGAMTTAPTPSGATPGAAESGGCSCHVVTARTGASGTRAALGALAGMATALFVLGRRRARRRA